MKIKFLSALALTVAAVQCAPQTDIIQENVDNAAVQLKSLIEASEAGDTVRIPSTYQNGEIVYVPTDDWVSGFFAGTLWYMYELTGDEYWADHARKHTEILDSIQNLKWHHDIGFMIYDSYGNGLRDIRMLSSIPPNPFPPASDREPESSSHGIRTRAGRAKEAGSAL